ncbi:hypothetical protein N7481_003738 [Penicillium waksmanii]|uniref:uncharacterized protein n=1 Tax=Penicillium waksmanii TaxID=69791 RepID=UPI00254929D4|nr:uncharacterized protein N7481_003738 [Penicillium waksmanii]KAJ5988528.1 hypothetical protein N7481_003738 [Penicillium waksmanii]
MADITVPMLDKRIKLVVGIDFGTTFSGYFYVNGLFADCCSICWGLEGDDDIEVIQEWPGKFNVVQVTSPKAPSVLAYQYDHVRWGYQVDEMKEAVRGVKLLLDKSKELKFGPAIESEHIIEKMFRTPVDVAAEYLKEIFTHAKCILERRGIASLMKNMDVQYILTVPAIWSDKAKDLTMQAAHRAGIPESGLLLLSEPEAAAIYTIRTIQANSIAKGDSFIVCDAGGGTVDLITYRITQTEPIRMEEIVEGTGEVCGSVMLDERFEAFLSNAVGETRYLGLPDSSKRHALLKWQNDIKPSYSGPEKDEFLDAGYTVPIPGVPDFPEKQIYQGMLHLENEDVQQIFDAVVEKIEILIYGQQEKAIKAGAAPKAIFLVGGLGASEYLYKRLSKRFDGLDIMQPKNAGAVYRGFEGNQIQERKSRCHYGVIYHTYFDSNLHKKKDRFWCPYEERWKANGNMRWYIHRGDAFSEGKPVSFPFYRTVPLDGSFVFHDYLHVCVMEKAPALFGNGEFFQKSVAQHCRLESDLSKIPKKLFKIHTNSRGIQYYRVNYNMVLTPQSITLLFEVQMNSMSYGTVRAQYY